MPGWTIELHPSAIDDARAAYEWYAERSETAAQSFLCEIDKAIHDLSESPNRWPAFVSGTRRYLLKRFPFFLVFEVDPNRIVVLAVAHARRRPGYWRDRQSTDE
jgi:plasmid stabilization system protein ParE